MNRPPFLIEFGSGKFRYVFDIREVIGVSDISTTTVPGFEDEVERTTLFTKNGTVRIIAPSKETLARWSEAKVAWQNWEEQKHKPF